MRNKVLEFSFLPQGSIKGQKMTFLVEAVVTGTLSTFHRIHKWYSRIWLGMTCRCAMRFRNFHFIPRGQLRAQNRHFFLQSFSLELHIHCLCYFFFKSVQYFSYVNSHIFLLIWKKGLFLHFFSFLFTFSAVTYLWSGINVKWISPGRVNMCLLCVS